MSRNCVNVPLRDEEIHALVEMATQNCRHPRDEMRFLLRQEAERRGLLPEPCQGAGADRQPSQVVTK